MFCLNKLFRIFLLFDPFGFLSHSKKNANRQKSYQNGSYRYRQFLINVCAQLNSFPLYVNLFFKKFARSLFSLPTSGRVFSCSIGLSPPVEISITSLSLKLISAAPALPAPSLA